MENRLQLAQELAKRIHSEHPRLSGESYYNHVQKTAKLLKDIGVQDEQLLLLAYLHHALDLSSEFKAEIQEKFGKETIELIEKYNQLKNSEIKQIKAKDLNQKLTIPTFLNLTHDLKLILFRMADKTANISTAFALDDEKRRKAAERALFLYDPICQLLGIYHFSHILQNEAFKIVNPAEYVRIENYIKKALPRLKKTMSEIEGFLNEIFKESNIEAKVEWRIKNIYSIFKKFIRKDQDIDSIYDIAAFRVLVNTIEDCYRVEGLLNELWTAIPDQRDDYIQKPKPSGYKSLHNVFYVQKNVPLEVQIKTFAMHEENEFGAASHLIYKMGETFIKELRDNPEFIKSFNYHNQNEAVVQTFDKNVYVFTPKGDIIQLPKGSSLVDFAYALHAGIGNSCVGGIVNGQIHKLDYELKNGDRVEIKTVSSKKKPSEDWLKMVKTHKARTSIRKALKLE